MLARLLLLLICIYSMPLYASSLGINVEEVQAEADDVGGQPIPFVDIFKVARPFTEYSCSKVKYDTYGWPSEIPDSCADEISPYLHIPTYAITYLLRDIPTLSIPMGDYTLTYKGQGTIVIDGIGEVVKREDNLIKIRLSHQTIARDLRKGLRIMITDTVKGDHIRDIKLIMPGGTCKGDIYTHARNMFDCYQPYQYSSFVEKVVEKAPLPVWNPDYLRVLSTFKVVRMMNLMKASPRNPCYKKQGVAYTRCLEQSLHWEDRALLTDAMWGGSFRTALEERAGKGIPLEAVIDLANTLQIDPWFNMPHNATLDYQKCYTKMVAKLLDSKLKAYVEYSNEPWNYHFWGAAYTKHMGRKLDLHSSDYWAGLYYYVDKAVESFKVWEESFGGNSRIVRVLNSYHNSGHYTTRNMILHNDAYNHVDAVATAPYFYGCWDRKPVRCQDTDKIPMTISEAKNVDDIFSIINNPNDPYGIVRTVEYTKNHLSVLKPYGVYLISYEGGQHLTVMWGDSNLSREHKDKLLTLTREANRDQRMKDLYLDLLHGWFNNGGGLFTIYTLPQTYHKYGSFGIKEHLNQPTYLAPKLDAIYTYLNTMGDQDEAE